MLLSRILLLTALGQPVIAVAQFGIGASTDVEFIENPLRTAESGENEVLTSSILAMQLNRQTKHFGTALNYSLNRQEYKNDFLNDQTRVEGSGSLVWNIMPDTVGWRITNTRSDQLVDTSQPDILDNRQIIDYTSTGPTLTLPVGTANLVSLSADVGAVNFGAFDGLKQNRSSLNFSFTRLLSTRLSAVFQSNYTDADYKSASALNYKVSSYLGQLNYNSEALSVTVELGGHSMKRTGINANNPTFRTNMVYRLNSRLQVSAEYADSVEDLLSDLTSPSVVDQTFTDTDIEFEGNFGPTNSASIYKRTERSIGATYSEPSEYTIGVRYSNNDRENIGEAAGEHDERLSANLNIPLGNRWNLNASYEQSKREFIVTQNLQERKDLRIGANYRLSDQLSLMFSALESDQQGSGLQDNYRGKNISIGISFTR